MSDNEGPVINDEATKLQEEALRTAIQNSEAELEMFTTKREMMIETMKFIDEHFEALTEIAKIVEEHPRKIKPDYEYEEQDAFWKHKGVIEKINLWQQRNQLALAKTNAKLSLDAAEREIKRITEFLAQHKKTE